MLRHLMTSWRLNIWKLKIWLSQERKELSKWNKKHSYLFHNYSFRHTKLTSKNVADTTFNNWEKMERTASCVYYVCTVFRKTNIWNPPIRTRSCSYQGVRNVSFSENFAYVLNGWSVTNMRPCLASIIIKYKEYRSKTS